MAVKIITISRMFGSGGRTVGKRLADELKFEYYDREIIDRIAGETGFSKDYIAANSEYASTRFSARRFWRLPTQVITGLS